MAVRTRKSLNQTVIELIRRGLQDSPGAAEAAAPGGFRIDQLAGLPVIRSPRPLTAEDVRSLEDD